MINFQIQNKIKTFIREIIYNQNSVEIQNNPFKGQLINNFLISLQMNHSLEKYQKRRMISHIKSIIQYGNYITQSVKLSSPSKVILVKQINQLNQLCYNLKKSIRQPIVQSNIQYHYLLNHKYRKYQTLNNHIENSKTFILFQLQMNTRQKYNTSNQKDNQEQYPTSIQILQQNLSSKVGQKETQKQFNFLNQQLTQKINQHLELGTKYSKYLNETQQIRPKGKYNLQQIPLTVNQQLMTKYSKTNRLNHDQHTSFNHNTHYNNIKQAIIHPYLYQQNNTTTDHQQFNNNQSSSIHAQTQKNNYHDTKTPRKQNKYHLNSKRQSQKQTFELCHPKNIKPSQNKRQYINTLQSRLQQTRMIKQQEGNGLKKTTENYNKTPSINIVSPVLNKNQQTNQKQTIELEDTMTIVDGQQPKFTSAQSTPSINKTAQSSIELPSNQPISSNNNPNTNTASFKHVKKHFKQKWSSQQDSVLVKTYIEKGGLHHCVMALKQVYGDNQKYQPQHIKYRIDLIVHRVFMKFSSLNTKNQNIIQFRENKQFILRKSGLAPRRRMYQDILTIYSSMLNMTEETREIISKKIIQINHICTGQRQTRTAITK